VSERRAPEGNARSGGRLHLIANPRAGGGRALSVASATARSLEALGIAVVVRATHAPGHAEELARELPRDVEVVLVAGGDGTLWEVVNGLVARGAPLPELALLPAGTGDALARDLSIATPEDGLAAFLAGERARVDLARVRVDGRERVVFSVVGWGAFARINRRAERLRWAGRARYELAALLELLRPFPGGDPGGPKLDGVPRREATLLGVACLTRHTGRGLCIAPEARLDDGLADVVRLRRGPRRELLSVLRRLPSGEHVRSPLVEVERVTELELAFDPPSWIVLDGEALLARDVRVVLEPRALTVFAPRPATGG